ncbi:protein O-mannosyl-transferase 2-like [Diadema setosum]|uniref:protein O-mannosyl-transferase 2-like n=1 Tax=Diadema setosum TaxID=31175 RepID=UPI003B39FB7A
MSANLYKEDDNGVGSCNSADSGSKSNPGKELPSSSQSCASPIRTNNCKSECTNAETTAAAGERTQGRSLQQCTDSVVATVMRFLPFSVITILAFATRFYKLSEPDHVCWDETHFGKMGSYYINRTFFFDVHPPLGKMLIGLSGYLTGYDGSFPFEKPGDKYGDTQYIGMRLFCSSLGVSVIPLTYLTVEEMTKSLPAAVLASSLVLFDVGCLTLSRYILLDPILLAFISASVFSLVKFHSCGSSPFSPSWWLWMLATGVCLAMAFSVKFVGLFVVLLAGITTAWDLWKLLGDLSLSKMTLLYHLAARVVCLICVPILVYIVLFGVHFRILNHSGNGDGFFSSAFQSSLIGNKLHNISMPDTIAYGSIITLKNQRAGGGLLHSHHHLYPEGFGAMQQQVTAYSHKDVNNDWLVKKFNVNPDPDEPTETPVEFVKHGDLVRLEHIPTLRNLHSHPLPAPLTARHQQVTCYGENGTGDVNDVWRVEIVGGRDGEAVKVVKTRLKLIHQLSGCALYSHSKQLPKWGWEQLEVTCNPFVRDKQTVWNVEDHVNKKLPDVSFSVFIPSFLESFLEAHTVMASGNSNLKPKEGEITSQPWEWPINYRGQRFSGANETDYRVYLLGNPIIWWGNLLLLALFCVLGLAWMFMVQRGYEISADVKESTTKMCMSGGWLLLGWLLHYLPFYLMGRVLYFHHYFPAMIFNSMLSGVFLDHCLRMIDLKLTSQRSRVHISCVVVVVAMIVHSFYLFNPLSYGMIGPNADQPGSPMAGLHWLSSWEF